MKPLSVMRRKIAEHMVLSRRTSAHVHTVFHVDFTTVDGIRAAEEGRVRAGRRAAHLPDVHRAACCESLRAYPVLNAALDGDTIVYKKDINLGIAVALDGGLIVPVVKQADTLAPVDLSKAIADLADARPRQAAEARGSARRARSPSPTPGSSARSSACRSSTSRRWPFCAWARSRSGRSS